MNTHFLEESPFKIIIISYDLHLFLSSFPTTTTTTQYKKSLTHKSIKFNQKGISFSISFPWKQVIEQNTDM